MKILNDDVNRIAEKIFEFLKGPMRPIWIILGIIIAVLLIVSIIGSILKATSYVRDLKKTIRKRKKK